MDIPCECVEGERDDMNATCPDVSTGADETPSSEAATNPTALARKLRAVDEARAAYDVSCKLLLADRQVAAYVLCDLLDEFAGEDRGYVANMCIEGAPVLGMPPGQESPSEAGTAPEDACRGSYSDVSNGCTDGFGFEEHACRDDNGDVTPCAAAANNKDPGSALRLESEDASLFEGMVRFDVRLRVWVPSAGTSYEIDFEPQDDFRPGYPLIRRAIYYLARMISQQGSAVIPGSNYGALRKVVSIWVCTDPPKRHSGKVRHYAFARGGNGDKSEMDGRGEGEEIDLFASSAHDCAEAIFVCLGPKARGADGALGMLEALLARDLSIEEKLALLGGKYGMLLEESVMREVRHMDDYWTRLYDKSYGEGRDEGRKEGRKEGHRDGLKEGRKEGHRDGLKEGRISTLVENVRDIASSLSMTVDAALDLLRTSDEERAAVRAALGE